MEYKPTYTKEEILELRHWFDTHTYEKELDMGGGIFIPDVKKTLIPMFMTAMQHYENKTFSGQIRQLFRIREELIKQNKVTGEK
ncbi:MAG: hypothetical protein K2I99_04955 [Bacteroidaceae bacterium]|nr:hypothetical protein [Bacteroidaceae bacterium]